MYGDTNMWFGLLSTGFKTAAAIYKNKKESCKTLSPLMRAFLCRFETG